MFPYTPYNKQKNHTLAWLRPSIVVTMMFFVGTAVRLSSYTLTVKHLSIVFSLDIVNFKPSSCIHLFACHSLRTAELLYSMRDIRYFVTTKKQLHYCIR